MNTKIDYLSALDPDESGASIWRSFDSSIFSMINRRIDDALRLDSMSITPMKSARMGPSVEPKPEKILQAVRG
ncbi:MAG: hypothetical protein D6703_00450 [Zetaproteobacteria bacterium]|nr:MAG: hypothetical protein D6703_00450 [Zetaproteobacteria bacterium]